MASLVLVNGSADVHAAVQSDLDGLDGFAAVDVFNQASASRRGRRSFDVFTTLDLVRHHRRAGISSVHPQKASTLVFHGLEWAFSHVFFYLILDRECPILMTTAYFTPATSVSPRITWT